MWFKRQENISATLIERVSKQETEISLLKSSVVALEMDMKTMRDKVLRKIQGKKDVEDEEKPKDRYSGMLIGTGE